MLSAWRWPAAACLIVMVFTRAEVHAQPLVGPEPAHAEEPATAGTPPPPTAATGAAQAQDARGPGPIAAALVLGPIAHGAGHFAAGEHRTGLRLLAAEGIGAFAAVGGLGGLALTGASEKMAGPLAGVTALGVGLFATSFLADVYGVVAPSGGFGRPVLRPALTAEAGLFGVIDPIFDYDALAHLSARAFVDRNSLALEGHVGVDHSNQRVRAVYAHRLLEQGAATYLEIELAALHHRFAPEHFSQTFLEAAVSGRLALEHVAPTLQGAFVDAAFGAAIGAHRYFGLHTESDNMLLIRIGFGFFIGDGGSWQLYYDHRHDGYAAGLKVSGLGSGVLGHVGTALQVYVSENWGFALRAESGSAHVLGASLLYRRKRW